MRETQTAKDHGTAAMNSVRTSDAKSGGVATGALLAAAVTVLALPSAVLAFTAEFKSEAEIRPDRDAIDSFSTNETPSGLARPRAMRLLAKSQPFPFTPAGTPERPDRSVMVAVRVDPNTAHAISSRRSSDSGSDSAQRPQVRIAPTAFNLGVSRGYKNFAQDLVPPARARSAQLPDFGQFSIASDRQNEESRFRPRIVIDDTPAAGRAPRTFAGESDDTVDVGGSYRVTDNLDVTAGVRYSEERERLLSPLTDSKQDNQAVYVGTQFRF